MNTDQQILQVPKPGDGSCEDQADAWLVYLYSGKSTAAAEKDFSVWLKSPDNAAAYARAEQLWRDLGFAFHQDDTQLKVPELRAAAPVVALPTPKRKPSAGPIIAWATAAMLLLAVGLWWLPATQAPVESQYYATNIGEVKALTLADESVITLSGDSRISVTLAAQERRIELIRGRAYFDISSDATRPFTVEVAKTDVRVVGTEFDISKGQAGVLVSVTEGVVSVRDRNAPIDVSGQQVQQQLVAGQRVIAALDGVLGAPEEFNPQDVMAWQSGQLRFVDVPLREVVEEVNRYRSDDKKIRLMGDELGEYRITASFKSDKTDQLLSGLKASYTLNIASSPVGVIVKPAANKNNK
ncbi:FecR family protein [Zhongshania aquimaris]|uniref:FecR domain-containing protein n=1 Tax=Zhongshania aquimaris TaxID=2857107 RepID=A0ABS6VV49_9GAMM|nr:FecR domain-containing protein [Zhongshania aquimaris]MBW2942166.1 FecR domain-containing protein [Zhongshania aquimaris]